MSTREERLGAEVLELVHHFHERDGREQQEEPTIFHPHRDHLVRSAVVTALEAMAVIALAHRFRSQRGRRLVPVLAAAYLRHRTDGRHG